MTLNVRKINNLSSDNTASGKAAIIAGGVKNIASGKLSIAMGYKARAIHDNSAVVNLLTDRCVPFCDGCVKCIVDVTRTKMVQIYLRFVLTASIFMCFYPGLVKAKVPAYSTSALKVKVCCSTASNSWISPLPPL